MSDLSEKFQVNKPLSGLSTFGIGGPAEFFIEIQTIAEMQELLSYCSRQKLPYIILGKGSNVLFDDRGFKGLAILNKIAFCEYSNDVVYVGAGYSFSLLGVQTARKGFSGLEFASGIPGSVGGAVFMNAGASGASISDVITEIHFVDEKGNLILLNKERIEFRYRFSSFQEKKGAIVAAKFGLTPSKEARQKQLGIVDYRTRTQPYGEKSAGCVFRNPQVGSAGSLIEQCGLKGQSIGDAQVSTLHANFIVNLGKATAKDVELLASLVQREVKEKKNVDLEFEVRKIPYELKDK